MIRELSDENREYFEELRLVITRVALQSASKTDSAEILDERTEKYKFLPSEKY